MLGSGRLPRRPSLAQRYCDGTCCEQACVLYFVLSCMSPSRFLQLRQHPHAGFAKMRMDAGHEYLGMSFVFGDAPVQKLHPHWQVAIEDTSPMNLCVRREAHEFIRGAIPPNITRQQKPLSSSPRASGPAEALCGGAVCVECRAAARWQASPTASCSTS